MSGGDARSAGEARLPPDSIAPVPADVKSWQCPVVSFLGTGHWALGTSVFHVPLGYVSGGSSLCWRGAVSSGVSADVVSKWITASNCLAMRAAK